MLHFGIIDSANSLLTDAGVLIRSAVSLAVLVIVVVVGIKTRFAVSTTLITALLGGFVIWIVSFGGLEWIAGGIAGETSDSLAPTTSVTQIW
jgi:hypothetical protein